MAGNPLVKEDPAIERWNRMREDAYLHFRWTRRTVQSAVVGFIVVPGIVYYLASKYQYKYDWQQRKGQPLMPSAAKQE
ncbi:putative nadh ubiquinone oxidoreductase [Lyophyllum shimeji]|uniref:NADH dehydrogenase [ubiquinone] 1 beta subcomplex subunit 4 n=1 Tax=Lyophyllum shimeji TaxID=47721 RepID=A0A9P3PFY6_LYOSH|nr:putative nadh ubiquinone oxidoreductase [Lyophyllum shimeji]